MTIRDFFDNAVSRYPQRPVQVFFRGGEWTTRTYGDFRARVLRASEAIRRLGIEPARHNVALILENCPEWQEIYLALACIGLTVVPIDPKLRPREISHILKDSQAVAVFAGEAVFAEEGDGGGERRMEDGAQSAGALLLGGGHGAVKHELRQPPALPSGDDRE